ncbi:hypothetical protein [Streptomyces vilmorinianum]|uniref:hypothetical protein n=1 Tax=Streptomyces vilmorinianum TaxID=3051092 RepID=UPI0015869551|nr:hypothetical protein [Streptomyces vilmorinianum]
MDNNSLKPRLASFAPYLTALVSVAAWAAWLGWDQERDVHPDGHVTGPYEAWQVVGLVLTLLVPVYWAASRRHVVGAAVGTTAGLTVAACFDWSDDATGLFGIGVGLVMAGSLAATFGVSALIVAVAGRRRSGDQGRQGH